MYREVQYTWHHISVYVLNKLVHLVIDEFNLKHYFYLCHSHFYMVCSLTCGQNYTCNNPLIPSLCVYVCVCVCVCVCVKLRAVVGLDV